MKIVAREKEKAILRKALQSGRPEFIAIYGRRRVGKTYLIRNFFQDKATFFHVTGVEDAAATQQLWNFNEEFGETFCSGIAPDVPDSWNEALKRLRQKIAQLDSSSRIVLFFDEFPWLATKKSGFIQAFSYLWNRHLSNDPRIIVVICGSASSWIIKNVINAKGSLHNRVTRQIRLMPFTLKETEDYLKFRNVLLSRKAIIELYMVMGGIPAYLNLVEKGLSAAQIIDDVCFSGASGALLGEFNRLFKSLFQDYGQHVKVIEVLAGVRSGLGRKEIVSRAGITSGSVQSKILSELTESGFIAPVAQFGKRKKGQLYRLIDEYSLFYLKWRDEISTSAMRSAPRYWLTLQNTQKWKSWSGYAFETVCHNHISHIADALGISGIIWTASTWQAGGTTRTPGAQIDLCIDRGDNAVNLCEIKFCSDTFTLSKQYAAQLQQKKAVFQRETKTTKTIFITLITPFGAKQNSALVHTVQNQLTMAALF